MKKAQLIVILAILPASAAAIAHEKASRTKDLEKTAISTEERPFGREGDPRKVARAIKVDMSDAMRFTPAELSVKQGETIRFEVRNSGRTIHEMVLGTMKELKDHAELMKKHPGMEHDEPYMAHAAPAKTERIARQVTKPGNVHFIS